MLTNGFLKNKKKFKIIQKAIMTGIGATTSQEIIKKAAAGLYDDIQKIVQNLLKELEVQGELKAKETKEILTKLQKKSDFEKSKVYKRLQKDLKVLITTAKDLILTPFIVLKDVKKFSGTAKEVKPKTKKAKRKK